MAHGEAVRVPPEAMRATSQTLSVAARDFRTRLAELDGHVRDLLNGWHGGSGGAYGEAWDMWHRGAAEVQQGLAILAQAIDVVGIEFDDLEGASTQKVDGVNRG